MVFVWSYLTDGDPAYTLVQVSLNDLIRETTRKRPNKMKTGITASGISQTLAAVCEPRATEAPDHEPSPEASVHELPPSLG